MPAMSDTKERTSLSVGQVAVRWGCSRERVQALIRAGRLAAFRMPSAGRFGEATRVSLAAVLAAEEAWSVLPVRPILRPPQPGRKLKHLRLPCGPCPEGDPG